MTDPISTILVGYGVAGRFFHAPFLTPEDGYRINAVVTRSSDRATTASAEHPGAHIFPTLREAIASTEAELVVIASPPVSHTVLALEAIDAGKTVVIDKPVAPSVADAVAIRDAAQLRGTGVAVFHNRRWDGDFQTVSALLDEAAVGDVARFEASFYWMQHSRGDDWKARSSVTDGGGVLHDVGPHVIDQALSLFGPASVTHAEMLRRGDVAAPDDVFLVLEHDSGVVSHLTMSTCRTDPLPRFRLDGSNGSYTVHGMDPQEAQLRTGTHPHDAQFGEYPAASHGVLRRNGKDQSVPTSRGNYEGFYRGLRQHIRDGAAVPVSLAEAIQGLSIIEDAIGLAQKSATGKRKIK